MTTVRFFQSINMSGARGLPLGKTGVFIKTYRSIVNIMNAIAHITSAAPIGLGLSALLLLSCL
ncbi:MAG: hypothetical protein ACJAXK_002088 [Yoonia sp.]|jgi:hypothetical protein